jgi:hypothetical protein
MLWLMAALLIKHFFSDFPMQTAFMLRKGQRDGWAVPLLAHSSVHGALTLAILLLFGAGWLAVALASAEVTAHFAIDRIKAHPDLGGRWTPANPYFWWALGADQLAHGLCYVAICAAIGGVQ